MLTFYVFQRISTLNTAIAADKRSDLVGSDPTFSAHLLQCVNSVEFGLAHPVTDVRRALTLLGLHQTRQVTVNTVATAIIADQIGCVSAGVRVHYSRGGGPM